MTRGDRPLPTPPRSRFGGAREEADGAEPLTADRMAQAAAAGRLEEFLQQEIPAGDHARNLALMMMGMSGLMPADLAPGPPPEPGQPSPDVPAGAPAPPPAEVLRAVGQGDVAELVGLLQAEHAKRCGDDPAAGDATPAPGPASATAPASAAPARPGIDAALVEELIRIAADSDVTVDWLLLRAVRLYVEEYRRTGKL